MSEIRHIDPQTLSDPSGFGYSQVVVGPGGGSLVYISGPLGDRPDGRRAESFEDQVAQAFDNLGRALAAAGSDSSRVLKITLLVVDHDEERLKTVSAARRALRRSPSRQHAHSGPSPRRRLDAV